MYENRRMLAERMVNNALDIAAYMLGTLRGTAPCIQSGVSPARASSTVAPR